MVSSAARIPFPSATSVSATLSRSWLVMRILPVFVFLSHVSCDRESPFSLRHPRDRLDDRHAYVSRRAQWVVPLTLRRPARLALINHSTNMGKAGLVSA